LSGSKSQDNGGLSEDGEESFIGLALVALGFSFGLLLVEMQEGADRF
jgi:hypothetical protein